METVQISEASVQLRDKGVQFRAEARKHLVEALHSIVRPVAYALYRHESEAVHAAHVGKGEALHVKTVVFLSHFPHMILTEIVLGHEKVRRGANMPRGLGQHVEMQALPYKYISVVHEILGKDYAAPLVPAGARRTERYDKRELPSFQLIRMGLYPAEQPARGPCLADTGIYDLGGGAFRIEFFLHGDEIDLARLFDIFKVFIHSFNGFTLFANIASFLQNFLIFVIVKPKKLFLNDSKN